MYHTLYTFTYLRFPLVKSAYLIEMILKGDMDRIMEIPRRVQRFLMYLFWWQIRYVHLKYTHLGSNDKTGKSAEGFSLSLYALFVG